jgi:type VI secretion system secreted protein Hcp
MAVDIYLSIDGIKGESKGDGHKDEIDVLSFSWGMSQSGSSHTGSGSGAGKVSMQDMSFTHYIDKSTPPLMLYCANGKHASKAELTVRKAGEKPVDYLKITMEQVMVTNVQTGGHQGDDRMTENFTLNFAKVKVVYTEQLAGGGTGAKPEMGWDIPVNKSA